HPVGDQKAADDVAGGCHDGDGSKHLGEHRPLLVLATDDDDRTHHRDRVQGVGERHQRRVQQRRYPPDHFKTDESGQHEAVEAAHQVQRHELATSFAKNSFTRGFATSPPRVSRVSRMISSSRLSCSFPSLVRCSKNALRFREYIWLAWYGTVLARFTRPTMVTPYSTTISPDRVSSQLPPRSAARSTITEPGVIRETISLGTSTGDFFPGTTAAVITTSLSATTL